jgi:DNA-binding MarR family transcriptional regulator
MKIMNNANISKSKEKDVFVEMVEAVFLFIHDHYGEFGAILSEYDINYSQYAALMTVFMHGTITEGELARNLFINASTVSRMIYALENRGWVRSERDKKDRRKVLVSLSPAGKRRMNGMARKQAEVVAREVEVLDAEKKDYVIKVAEFVNQALRYMVDRRGEGNKDEG